MLETALTLTVLGAVFAAAPAVVRIVSQASGGSSDEGFSTSAGIDSALGFVMVHDRLPCPDTTGDGLEDCGSEVGQFPYLTAGLPGPLKNADGNLFRYGVYQRSGIDLSNPSAAYSPVLSNGPLSASVNGLDLCGELQKASLQTYSSSALGQRIGQGAGSVNVAFVFVDPGQRDADLSSGIFDGANAAGVTFESSSTPRSYRYDDVVAGVGFHQLLGHLQCARRIAVVEGAALEEKIASDSLTSVSLLKTFFDNNLTLAKNMLKSAQFRQAIAVTAGAASTASSLFEVASALTTTAGKAATALAATQFGIAAGMLATDTYFTIQEVNEKTEGKTDANALVTLATSEVAALQAALSATQVDVRAKDQRGFFQ